MKLTTEEFIEKARSVHGSKYDYSLTNYKNYATNIIVICPKENHGKFEITPNNHLSGRICQKCSKENKIKKLSKTTESFIESAIKIHGNTYNYSLVNYVNNSTKIKIICKNNKHGEFYQIPQSHLSGSGCPKCVGKFSKAKLTKTNNTKYTTETFIIKAKTVHDNKYDYSCSNFINILTKIKIKCIKHNLIFEQTPETHLKGSGCPTCGHDKRIQSMKFSQEYFIKKSIEIHGNKYDYSNAKYKNRRTKVKIFCKNHNGYFTQTAGSHLKGNGCDQCHNNYSKEFIKKANITHNFKYDYSESIYLCSKVKIKIICPKHKEFYQLPSSHLSGKGCKFCAKNRQLTAEEFKTRADIIHENKYEYFLEDYINLGTPIKIKCKKHDLFIQKPGNHLKGRGCLKCRHKNEALIGDILNKFNISYVFQQYIKTDVLNFKFDYWLPEYNLAIEYNGEQHYKPVRFGNMSEEEAVINFNKQQIRDNFLRQWCKTNDIILLEIDGRKYQREELKLFITDYLRRLCNQY